MNGLVTVVFCRPCQSGADGQCPELSQSRCGRSSGLLAVARQSFSEEEGPEEEQGKSEWSDAGHPLPGIRTSGAPRRWARQCVNDVSVINRERRCNRQRVVAAGFRRPVVLFGPIADAANEKLASEMPDLFVIASESLPASFCPCVCVRESLPSQVNRCPITASK